MIGIHYTLLGDGPADRLLKFPLEWVIRQQGAWVDGSQWADLTSVRPRPQSLGERVRAAMVLYPCNLLFVHRDAEKESYDFRRQQVEAAVDDGRQVPVIPVRMSEAWLLHEETAIRRASGNPIGRTSLELPQPKDVEALVDPKQALFDALMKASELSGRRLKQLKRRRSQMRWRVAELINDYAPLVGVPAFDRLIEDVRTALAIVEEFNGKDMAGNRSPR